MAAQSDAIMQSVLGYLNTAISGDSPRHFMSWAAPGIPYEPEDLEFAKYGLGKPANLPDEGKALKDIEGDPKLKPEPGMTAGDHARMQYMQAEMFSRIANFIPDIGGIYSEDQQLEMYEQTGASFPDIYGKVLQNMQVAATPLTDEEKALLGRINTALTVTVEEEDWETGDIVKRPEESPLIKRYHRFAADYEAAALAYNALAAEAQSSDDDMTVRLFALNGPILEQRKIGAMDRWVAQGRKDVVERMMSVKAQIEGRGLALTLRELRQRFERGRIRNPSTMSDFYFTTLVPPTFADALGWQKVTISQSTYRNYRQMKATRYGGSASLNFGLFRIGGGAGRTKERKHFENSGDNFQMEFEVTQVPLVRAAWCDPSILALRSWKFPENMPDILGVGSEDLPQNTVSDGDEPPRGVMAAYPTAAIFARNIKIRSSNWQHEGTDYKSEVNGRGSVSYGPFRLSGGGEHKFATNEVKGEVEGQELQSPGMQIIGFRNYILPKSPNPDPSIPDDQWVADLDGILETIGA